MNASNAAVMVPLAVAAVIPAVLNEGLLHVSGERVEAQGFAGRQAKDGEERSPVITPDPRDRPADSSGRAYADSTSPAAILRRRSATTAARPPMANAFSRSERLELRLVEDLLQQDEDEQAPAMSWPPIGNVTY